MHTNKPRICARSTCSHTHACIQTLADKSCPTIAFPSKHHSPKRPFVNVLVLLSVLCKKSAQMIHVL